jgi:chemotaxis protein CheD
MGYEDRRRDGRNVDGVLVKTGEIVVVDDGARLVSVVSRGALVCLWHTGGHHAAMLHFVEPAIYDVKKATARFGNVALPRAISMLREALHDPLASLEAQLFGCACRDHSDLRGQENLAMARKILKARNISIVSEDVGGSKGRKVLFDAQSGHAMVIKVHALREGDWEL